jgi:hypothetical protein
MANIIRKRKFSNNQIVVFRFGERNLVGKICDVKQVGKRSFIYDVKGEDGIIYEELGVDAIMNHTIDTYKTKLFYKKYNISEDRIPEIEQEDAELGDSIDSETEEVAETSSKTDEETLFSDEDTDPNW